LLAEGEAHDQQEIGGAIDKVTEIFNWRGVWLKLPAAPMGSVIKQPKLRPVLFEKAVTSKERKKSEWNVSTN
jgi:hypothetical protein